jgi:hypothetical protein
VKKNKNKKTFSSNNSILILIGGPITQINFVWHKEQLVENN